jgi:hypothetical protein
MPASTTTLGVVARLAAILLLLAQVLLTMLTQAAVSRL